jgi:hypothetical protein
MFMGCTKLDTSEGFDEVEVGYATAPWTRL